ncbi:MAG: phosphoribosylglycinamide synthetase C domain-containing protein [Candidatus Pacebacteria bacterium]|nr:phosphoribosylglycinamide synthetase C domain-containing protein [Candidatus Paceibacterota bacterium]
MKILVISGELIGGDLAYRLKNEGNEVKLYIEDENRKDSFDGMIDKTKDWEKELEWVGKDGLIVFDDIGYGKEQDELRANGYTVFGGCEEGDKLELDREYAQKVFKDYDIGIIETVNFKNIKSAIDYIEKNKNAWVVKQNAHLSSLCYVGCMNNGADALSLLENYSKYFKNDLSISLQKKVDGIEIGVARYFNGKDWIGPIEINIEHKSFLNNDIGPLTGEMGTVMWYESEENKLFKETLKKLKPYLEKIKYKGDIDINCIVNEFNVFPLEATARLGSPAVKLQDEIHISRWTDFLMAGAKGNSFDLEFNDGYSIVVSITIPPFPYEVSFNTYLKGVNIFFKEELAQEEKQMIHFEEVSYENDEYFIAGSSGSILFITGTGKTIEEARKKVYGLIDKIIIPKMMYRTDIGLKFLNNDIELLKKWKWINK